ncbi:hypothetical protein QAD02_005232 [Eretmocerus hayati]|uniref:Uncharacterized protein n=1 Tax=Eretmocerus hayati TaxID=131215 RepID=A0ACC2NRY2_9HYME|nr:hypothetical protein QAD02_005232 [Eretmocerus hayati]
MRKLLLKFTPKKIKRRQPALNRNILIDMPPEISKPQQPSLNRDIIIEVPSEMNVTDVVRGSSRRDIDLIVFEEDLSKPPSKLMRLDTNDSVSAKTASDISKGYQEESNDSEYTDEDQYAKEMSEFIPLIQNSTDDSDQHFSIIVTTLLLFKRSR